MGLEERGIVLEQQVERFIEEKLKLWKELLKKRDEN